MNALSKTVQAVGSITVAFSPRGGGQELIVAAINGAVKTIDIMAYEFSARPIIDAVLAAKTRGVVVRCILDKSQLHAKYSALSTFLAAGIPLKIDVKPPIAHNKVMVIDGVDIVTGSYNFTDHAELNSENVLCLRGNADLAMAYQSDFEWRWLIAESYFSVSLILTKIKKWRNVKMDNTLVNPTPEQTAIQGDIATIEAAIQGLVAAGSTLLADEIADLEAKKAALVAQLEATIKIDEQEVVVAEQDFVKQYGQAAAHGVEIALLLIVIAKLFGV